MSKYATVANDIRSKILEGTYEPGQKIPTIPELCDRYDVSKITIKRAMDDLEAEGLVVRRRGSGTFVTGAKALPRQQVPTDSSHTHKVHEFVVVHPNPEVAARLDLQHDEFVFRICRTTLDAGLPLAVERLYVPLSVATSLRASDALGSIDNYLEASCGVRCASAHQQIRATLPNELALEHLQVAPDQPVLEVRETHYSDEGQACMLMDAWYVPSFEITVIRPR